MSSDDSGFDKEAEREKLREKYGDEDEDRENTRRMSELLLQGATMTGKHCDNCGDPIFRHDGQEFCPTCQHEAREQTQVRNAESQGQSPDETDPVQRADSAEESAGDADQSDDEPRVEINDVRVADQHGDHSNVRRPSSQADDRRASDDGRGAQNHADRQRGPHGHRRSDHTRSDHTRSGPNQSADQQNRARAHRVGDQRRGDGRSRTGAGRPTADAVSADDLGPAREALVRKLTDLARQAEETDDVARSRELLSATREAAEALAALDRANR
ncbi:Sjogren's syndrome/scleroderma autoantigen 1 family protein [Halorussus lipolyticus]|uniref:Sjogren's syndrome/scleroderma autoantigen 1 family protein n=1 Tax=Halorussus lipolyticus TaxID=3034024 RepID=UPI0023E7F22B|nr:Sjogren's syndrome/scleroderma autoantigen 1 family protein [Halorussus sp. DT80]